MQQIDKVVDQVDRVSESIGNQIGHRPSENANTTKAMGYDSSVQQASPQESYGTRRTDLPQVPGGQQQQTPDFHL